MVFPCPIILTLNNAEGHSPPITTQIQNRFSATYVQTNTIKGRLNAQSTLYSGEPCTSPSQILQAVIPFFRTAILRITVYPSSGACNRFPIHVFPSLCNPMRPFRLPPAYRLHFFRLSSGIHSFLHDFSFLWQSRTVLSFYIKTGRYCSFHPLPQYLPVKTKNALETLSLTIYSLSMGTAILINKTFLTSEYNKLNSRVRHY